MSDSSCDVTDNDYADDDDHHDSGGVDVVEYDET